MSHRDSGAHGQGLRLPAGHHEIPFPFPKTRPYNGLVLFFSPRFFRRVCGQERWGFWAKTVHSHAVYCRDAHRFCDRRVGVTARDTKGKGP